jgi:filamentous hemagglutinin family protein
MIFKAQLNRIILTLLSLCSLPASAIAQEAPITADGTTATDVNSSDSSNFDINGGDKAGGNLFHSFGNFSVPNGGSANFLNSPDILNIINRVTGGKISDIQGLIKANGTANLFLINLAGIVFGENASLNIGGSFLGSTADSLIFPDGEFSAVNAEGKPLLTINAPIGLGIRDNPAPIENNSKADAGLDPAGASGYFGLRVPDGKSFVLAGGDIKANGGGIVTFGGRIDLAAVSGAGTVGLNLDGHNISFSVPNSISRGDVSLTNGAGFLVAGGGGGDIAITGKNIRIDNSSLKAGILSKLGSIDAQAGDIKLNALDALTIANNKEIENSIFSEASGNAGNIDIQTKTLNVSNSQVGSTIYDKGKGTSGNLTVKASDSIDLSGEIPGKDGLNDPSGFPGGLLAQVDFGGEGQSGNINIETKRLNVSNGSKIQAATFGDGNAGNLNIRASEINVFNTPDANNYFGTTINTGVSVDPRNVNPPKGNGGNLTIETDRLSIRNGAEVTTDTNGEGNAGNVKINANDTISVDGLKDGSSSRITSQVGFRDSTAKGNAGEVDITTKNLSVTNGGFISSSTFGEGDAGNVIVNATDNISIDTNSTISSNVEQGAVGNGGQVKVETGTLNLTNGGQLLTIVREARNGLPAGEGKAGDVTVNARGAVTLDGVSEDDNNNTFPSAIFSSLNTGTKGKAGNIELKAGSLTLANGAELNSNTDGIGDAGNVTIITDGAVNLFSGNIFTNVGSSGVGKGGNINIKAGELSLKDGAQLNTVVSFADPNSNLAAERTEAGNINLDVDGAVTLSSKDGVSTQISSALGQGREGKGGDINIKAGSFSLTDEGATGNIYQTVSIKSSTFGKGDAGKISVNAKDDVFLNGGSILSTVEAGAIGNGGQIQIDTGNFSLTNEGRIATSVRIGDLPPDIGNEGDLIVISPDILEKITNSGIGNAGDVIINARGNVNLDNRSIAIASSLEPGATGKAGNIKITSDSLVLTNVSQILSDTSGIGDAGNITINVRGEVTLDGTIKLGDSQISSSIFSGVGSIAKGKAGNIDITAKSLSLTDGADISSRTFGIGSEGGNINLNIDEKLTMRNNSSISAQAKGDANGGNININAPNGFIVAFPNQNNDIISTANRGKGGQITINAQSIYGFDKKNIQSITDIDSLVNKGKNNDINSTSGQPGLDGNININIQTLDPVKRTAQSSQDVVEPDTTVAQACSTNENGEAINSFTITGRGGMPTDPTKPLNSSILAGNSKVGANGHSPLQNSGLVDAVQSKNPISSDEIIPARGVAVNEKGQIVLTRYPTQYASDRPLVKSGYCSTSLKQQDFLATNTESDEDVLDDRAIEEIMNLLYSQGLGK